MDEPMIVLQKRDADGQWFDVNRWTEREFYERWRLMRRETKAPGDRAVWSFRIPGISDVAPAELAKDGRE